MNVITPIDVARRPGAPTVRIHRRAAHGNVFDLCSAITDLEERRVQLMAQLAPELELIYLDNEQQQLIRVLTKMHGKLRTHTEAVAVARVALLLTDKDDLTSIILDRLEDLYFKLAEFIAASAER
jgi:hypothetical protein